MAYLTYLNKSGKEVKFALEKVLTTLGRSRESDISLADNSVSNLHAHILRQGAQYVLTDLKSKNGTFVNEQRITKHILASGDIVRLGKVTLKFTLFEKESLAEQVLLLEEKLQRGHSVKAELEKLKKLSREIEEETQTAKNLKQKFETLLNVSLALNSLRDLNSILATIMDLAIKVLSAERGFIMLRTEKEGKLETKISRGMGKRDLEKNEDASISYSAIEKVIATQQPILISNTEQDTEFSRKKSIIRANIKAILCAPLINKHGELIGILYLDTSLASGVFSERDRDLVVGFATAAALAIENALLIEREKQAEAELARLEEARKYAAELEKLEKEREALLKEVEMARFEEIIGSSPQMAEVFKTIDQVAKTDATVLIEGATGTGKELVARAIHRRSLRKEKRFVVVNCGAIPENLLESELFGHERGAFTGAYSQKKGKFELADGGTIFLDEIGELPLALQPKILRVLQHKEIERVGAKNLIKVDVRVLAATNKDLRSQVEKRKFREDLFYRLNVIPIHLPLLKERGNDIILLANYFLKLYSENLDKALKGFSDEAKAALLSYSWPGNIRELENKIKRAVILAQREYITPAELELEFVKSGAPKFKIEKAHLEERLISQTLAKYHGNITQTASALGMSRRNLRYLLAKYKIDKAQFKGR